MANELLTMPIGLAYSAASTLSSSSNLRGRVMLDCGGPVKRGLDSLANKCHYQTPNQASQHG